MKRLTMAIIAAAVVLVLSATPGFSFWEGGMKKTWGSAVETLTPQSGRVVIPLERINDGKAHHFRVQADDGIMVTFFTLKSDDGVIRAAIDACDVCFRSGKGYVQSGDHMVCTNCGQRFAAHLINVVKGGCNPAPLNRSIEGANLVIAMADINANSWYMQYRK